MLVNAETLTVGLSVRLEAKPGRETDLEAFLRGAAPLAEAEPATLVWFAVRLGPTTFGIFDAFPDEAGRQAHLAGRIAAALGEHGIDAARRPTGDRTNRRAGSKTAVVSWCLHDADCSRVCCDSGLCCLRDCVDTVRAPRDVG